MARRTQPLDKTEPPMQQKDSSNYTQEPPNNLVAESEVVTMKVQPSPQEEQHRAAERVYWKRQLRVALWLNWVTTIAVVAGILSLVYIKQTLDVTRESVNVAVQSLVLSERPWLTVEATLTNPSIVVDSKRGLVIDTDVSLKNVGHSVATDVRVEIEMMLFPHRDETLPFRGPIEMEEQRQHVCESIRIDRIGGEGGKLVLFPDQQGTIKKRVRTPAENIKSRTFEEPPNLDVFVDLILFGCIAYGFPFMQGSHVTGFAYNIFSPTHHLGYFALDVVVPIKDIRLRPFPYMQAYID